MSLGKAKVPIFVTACILCLLVGIAGGVFGMTLFGYDVTRPAPSAGNGPQGMPPGGMMGGAGMMGGKGAGMMGGKGGGMMGGKGGGMMGMMGGGMNNPKTQLGSLVTKINQLSQKPLKIELTKEQQQKVIEVLGALAEKKELSNEEASDGLKSVLEILKDHLEVLQSVGVRLPGQMDPPPGPNPFLNDDTQKHWQSLKKMFGVGKAL